MNESITYQWSEKLALSAMKAHYNTLIGRTLLMLIVGILMIIMSAVLYSTDSESSAFWVVGLILGVIFIGKPIRIHFFYKNQSRDVSRLIDDPTVTITITDESITQSASASTRTMQWSQLTKFTQSNSMILLWSGKALASSFPQEPFSQKQVEFIKSMTEKMSNQSMDFTVNTPVV